jgi:hypothetical protein
VKPNAKIVSLLLLGFFLAPARAMGGFEPLPDEQKTRLREAFRLAEQLGPEVWPGFDGRGAPVILIAGETEYLLNRAEPAGGFVAVPGDLFNGLPTFARARVFPPGLRASFPAIGVETVVVGTAEETGLAPAEWVFVVAHEIFHVFQASRGLDKKIHALAIGPPEDADWHLNFPFPYADTEVAAAVRGLGSALRDALTAPPGDRAQIQAAASEVRRELTTLEALLAERTGDARAYNYLRYQTGKEGVARYVEYRLAERAASGNPAYAALWEERYAGQLARLDDEKTSARERSQFYLIGLGLGLLLDRLEPAWKERYFEPGVWLDDLLEEALSE